MTIQKLTREEIQRVAEDLYIYGYPLLLMHVIKRTHTATGRPSVHSAPLNQFAHERYLPKAHDSSYIHANGDCLKSSAWLDLSKEPVVLSIPPNDRYFLLSFFSGWYEIFETSSPRNTVRDGRQLGFVGPRWHGKLPAGVKRIVTPTELVWIDGWFEANGAENIEVLHGVQDHFRLTPLSQWGAPPIPHSLPFRVDIDRKTSPQEQVAQFNTASFYTRLSRLMQKNPAPPCDAGVVAEFSRIGFFPSEDFAFELLPAETAQAMHKAIAAAQSRIAGAGKAVGRRNTFNNWSVHFHPGRYYNNYLDRAVAAHASIPAALAEDVICFRTAVDHMGEPLNGARRYVIKFGHDCMPPVNAFWSITLYDSRHHLVANEIHRHVIGDRDRLRLDPDNSLSLYIERDWPGTVRDSNWLPAPKEEFNLAFRMYWPKQDVLTGNWRPPAVMRAN